MEPQPQPRRLVGYVRVSSRKQAEEGLSPDVQREKIRKYADLHDSPLVAIYEDGGKSGGKKKRPGLLRALTALERNHADALVVVKLDRLTRSILHLAELLRDYFGPKAPFQLVAIEDTVDTSTASGKMMANILITVAEWERDIASERTLAVRRAKEKAGEFVGGDPPYGQQVVERGDVKVLKPDKAEQEVLHGVADMRAAGYSLQWIADHLNSERVPRRNGKPWSRQAVSRLLKEHPRGF